MVIGSPVRVYDEWEEWFSEGEVIAIDGDTIDVDFYDWVQRYAASDLTPRVAYYSRFFAAQPGAGITIDDFR